LSVSSEGIWRVARQECSRELTSLQGVSRRKSLPAEDVIGCEHAASTTVQRGP
jgi:hypothetical protein